MQVSAMNGLGIASLHYYAVAKDLQAKRLVEILQPYSKPPQSVYLFYLKDCYLQPKIRCFIDFYLTKMDFKNDSSS